MPKVEKEWQSVPKAEKVWQSVSKVEKVCQKLRENAKLREIAQKCEKVLKSMALSAKS